MKPPSSMTSVRVFGFMAKYLDAVGSPHHALFAAGLDAFMQQPRHIGTPDDFLYFDGGGVDPDF